ncbi:efflux transporter periplasmic adaptor subunit [Zobellella endophytica]|uniref:Efflux transporter periplasmic adaptor subunit n=1 Tax=Zobellella endophytica TaxID=2116700 RepID=A0A2P7RBT7_9GAMM|nr:efflux RND transporter periplasmic adaptor subunit [Zobellella endophytica]PSJ47669.1 efflux transporter periplasmic adaptor subunit [Zobellella endophytica]
MNKLLWAGLGILLALPVVGGLVLIKALQFGAMGAAAAQMQVPPEPVNTAQVREQEWQFRVAAVGSVVAVQGAVLRTEAEGQVREIRFEAGAMVKAGDELVLLDAEVERAQRREAESAAALARLSYRRARELARSRNISRGELDAAAANLQQANARLALSEALIDRKTLRAPFDGRLGIRRISIGQFLDKGSPVVSLQSLDPVYVEFSLPQQRLSVLATALPVLVSSDAYPGRSFAGRVSAFNPDVDAQTRSVRVQATLANPGGQLRPGMFVSVEMVLERTERVLLIPATAVQYGPYGEAVFVLEEEAGEEDDEPSLRVRQQPVRLGEHRGDFVVVTEGLAAGERVVSTGVFKLRTGMAVVVDNRLAPEFRLDPDPGNS